MPYLGLELRTLRAHTILTEPARHLCNRVLYLDLWDPDKSFQLHIIAVFSFLALSGPCRFAQ